MSTRLSDYDYFLPPHLIANRPVVPRDGSRMMVLRRADGSISHHQFNEIASFAGPGDCFVLNDTQVLKARRFSDDGTIEFLFLESIGPRNWKCLTKPGRKARPGATFTIGGASAEIVKVLPDGERVVAFREEIDPFRDGTMPLPPYVKRASDAQDEDQYQTVFARQPGAVAAPTAGLHFSDEILNLIPHTFVTLHVGPGTFRPVRTDNVAEHKMHSEKFSISPAVAEQVNSARRVIAVGTTTVRVLETAARSASLNSGARQRVAAVPFGSTDIFIYPPFEFRAVDVLLTNFHLPRSTLLLLVSAFAGPAFVLRAYEAAISEGYRFYSYGDCMLIV